MAITPQRPDWLAGAPGFEPGNGGIKIGCYTCYFNYLIKFNGNRGKIGWRSGRSAAVAHDGCKVGYFGLARYSEPCAEIVPEGNAELGADLGEAEKGVAAIAAGIAAGAAADLALGDMMRISFSDPLVLSGISGRSSAINSSFLLP